ncbi:MAG: hypothetical protein LBF68_07610 [Christensenellaceae bacterium]|jgi:hypothetical protein|nr:hypothetical protein [Christensenellaceae bacterium]
MSKKILTIALIVITVLLSASILVSCNDDQDPDVSPYTPTFTSLRAKNVVETVANYPEVGVPSEINYVERFDATDINVSEGQNNNTHIQGISRYRNFMVIAINGNYEIRKNAIVLILQDGGGLVQRIETPLHIDDPELDVAHASGFQITGDYLFMVTTWHGFSANRGSDLLVVYDLSPLITGGEAKLYNVSTHEGIGNTLGISTVVKDGVEYLVWAESQGAIRMSPVPTTDPVDVYDNIFEWTKVEFTDDSVATAPYDAQSCAMVTDVNEVAYFFKLCNTDNGKLLNRYQDFIAVYRIDFVGDKIKYVEVVPPKYQIAFYRFSTEASPMPATFRFAGTVEVRADGDVWTYSSMTIPYSDQCGNLFQYVFWTINNAKYLSGESDVPPDPLQFQFNIWRIPAED